MLNPLGKRKVPQREKKKKKESIEALRACFICVFGVVSATILLARVFVKQHFNYHFQVIFTVITFSSIVNRDSYLITHASITTDKNIFNEVPEMGMNKNKKSPK